MLALLVDGNCYERRFGSEGRKVTEMSVEEIQSTFGDKKVFWMGTDRQASDSSVGGDEGGRKGARFGIWID